MHRISSQQPCSLVSTYLFFPDTVCHKLVRLLDDGNHIRSGYSGMLPHEQAFLNQTLMQLTCPGIPDWYCTPDFDDGSRLTLDRSVAGQITVTAYKDGMASDRHILTPAHPLWKNISNRLTHMHLIQEWRNWATIPAPGEQRVVALERVTMCITRVDTYLHLDCLGLTSLPDLPDSLTWLDVRENQLNSLPDLPDSLIWLNVRKNQLTALPVLPDALTRLDISQNYLDDLPPLPASLQGQDVGLSCQRTDSPTLASAIMRWYPAEQQASVRTAWAPRNTVENAGAFTAFLKRLDENPCTRSLVFRGQVAAWLDELLITPDLCTRSFAIAQEASAICTDRAALGWNNIQVERLLFHAVRNEQTTAGEFITLARKIFYLRQFEKIAGEKVRSLRARQENVDEIKVYLAYQSWLKEEPLSLPDCLALKMQYDDLARITQENFSAVTKVLLAEESEFENWLNNWAPWQQFLLKRMSEDERKELTERRTAVYGEKLKELRLEFSEAGSGTDVDCVLVVRATEATNNAIFGPLAELAFCKRTGQSSKGKEKG